jgi:hypothetical protein
MSMNSIERAIIRHLIDNVVCDPNLPTVPRFMVMQRIHCAAESAISTRSVLSPSAS